MTPAFGHVERMIFRENHTLGKGVLEAGREPVLTVPQRQKEGERLTYH